MSPFNPYTDVAREAQHDYYADEPHERDETPSLEDVAELGPPPPFTRPVAHVYDPIPDWSDLAAKWGRGEVTMSATQHQGRTHDYRDGHRGWGHDITYRPCDRGGRGTRLNASGWGCGIAAGDYILLSNGDADTRYSVHEISYHSNPADMWRATLKFAPRKAC